ncbi:MAG TPA: hypothetical protein VKA27_07365 [Sunxiuqinia sp.]|nr:hypothetical protein [Sunxiuqinia sp.]
MNKKYQLISILFVILSLSMNSSLLAQKHPSGKLADKPLYRDPVFDGAADPTLIWNKNKKKWFMFYTNRRANADSLKGVTWVHGTRIGIAESSDGGATWSYKDTANINYRPDSAYSFWAPEVLEYHGLYHMFLTYVPGVFKDWNHPRYIIHLTSIDLLNWNYVSTLQLASNKVIDACIIRMPNGNWRMWYNNELDGKSIYFADSPDLFHWHDRGKAIADHHGEGPDVFHWKDKYWMVVDQWAGLGVYQSTDLLHWLPQPVRILEQPGTGPEDGTKGGHPDVIVNGDRAFIFYFLHPGRTPDNEKVDNTETRRSLIQVAELHESDGIISCDRDEPVYINLRKK